MQGYDRIKALKKAIKDGAVSMAMVAADIHLLKGNITQAEFDELKSLAYPPESESAPEEVQLEVPIEEPAQ